MTNTLISPEHVRAAVEQYTHAENPSSFLAVNEGNSYFTLPGRPGVVVYRPTGRFLVQFGGPFAPAEDRADLLKAFVASAADQGRRVVGVQLQADDVELYTANGFTVNQVGASYAVDLNRFSLRGTRFMQLRNKISRCLRSGVTVRESTVEEWADGMHEVDKVWLRSKGEHARPLEFLVGQYGGPMQPHRRLFVAVREDELIGYISYSPVYGSRSGWMHDLSRRRPDNLPGLMEAINKAAIDTFVAEGVQWLHFGFTPFTGLSEDLEPAGHSPGFAGLMGLLWEHGEEVYPAQSQLAYKKKWAPDLTLPEYVAFQGDASLPGFVHVFRAAGAL
jgi:lysylphosphatidylglycerol synthetase-like protein (DUF2156 family)